MKHPYLLLFLLLLLILPTSCANVDKLLEQGKYQRAYTIALKQCTRGRALPVKGNYPKSTVRIQRKKKLKPQRISEFLAAYEAIQASDYTYVQQLRNRVRGDKWAELYQRYAYLHTRSLDLADLFPEEIGLTGNPELLPAALEARMEEARRNAGEYALSLAQPLLRAARSGYKPAARTAYQHYLTALDYLPEQEWQLAAVRDSLADIGTLRVLLYAPSGLEFSDRLQNRLQHFKPFQRAWTSILTQPTGERIDLAAEVVYRNYNVYGPTVSQNSCTYSKKVIDFIEKKEVKVKVNDSTTVKKIVEVKHYKKVHATVTTVKQHLSVTALGEVVVYPSRSDSIVYRRDLSGVSDWSNEYTICSGDERALPSACICDGLLGRDFPPNPVALLPGAVNGLAWSASRAIQQRFAPKRRQRDLKRPVDHWRLSGF